MKRTHRKTDDKGAELIELAIVLPILLLVVAGIMDFGFMFARYEAITNASREGARLASLPGYGAADVRARVRSYLDASGLSGATVPDSNITITPGSQTLPGGLVVNTLTVHVDYPSQFLFIGPIAAMVGGTGWTSVWLRTNSVMRVEGGS